MHGGIPAQQRQPNPSAGAGAAPGGGIAPETSSVHPGGRIPVRCSPTTARAAHPRAVAVWRHRTKPWTRAGPCTATGSLGTPLLEEGNQLVTSYCSAWPFCGGKCAQPLCTSNSLRKAHSLNYPFPSLRCSPSGRSYEELCACPITQQDTGTFLTVELCSVTWVSCTLGDNTCHGRFWQVSGTLTDARAHTHTHTHNARLPYTHIAGNGPLHEARGSPCTARALHATFRLGSPRRAPRHTPSKHP